MQQAFRLMLLLCLPVTLTAQEPVPVEVMELGRVLVSRELRAPAEVRSLNYAVIAAEVDGVVAKIGADVGEAVNKGTVLLELDPADQKLALQTAQAALASSMAQKERADARLQQAEDLGKQQFLSDDELLSRITNVRVLEAEINSRQASLANARRQLEKCTVRAPFSGVVSDRQAQLGSYVNTGKTLFVFIESDRFEVAADIPVHLAESIGQARWIRFDSLGTQWPVSLERLSPVIGAERRTRQARFTFTGQAAAIGASGEIVWNSNNSMVPAHLVVRRDGSLGLFTHHQGRSTFVPLPGAQEGRPVMVELPLDTEIIVAGRERLQDGDAVRVSR